MSRSRDRRKRAGRLAWYRKRWSEYDDRCWSSALGWFPQALRKALMLDDRDRVEVEQRDARRMDIRIRSRGLGLDLEVDRAAASYTVSYFEYFLRIVKRAAWSWAEAGRTTIYPGSVDILELHGEIAL